MTDYLKRNNFSYFLIFFKNCKHIIAVTCTAEPKVPARGDRRLRKTRKERYKDIRLESGGTQVSDGETVTNELAQQDQQDYLYRVP